ncbi:DUF6339 family protein [Xylanibacter oryzae]|uniref:DUF6339 family protein n=1 Tax=Xylanibacter oryzae TaxID=185293 RepID=UPI0004AF6A28|nr:DUF6339 family protein [Xylanibacter oryzae]
MALQKIFKKTCIEKVFDDVENGIGLDKFLQDDITFEEDNFLITPQVKAPENLLYRMIPTTEEDYKSAIALYDAYKTLKPLQAINIQFWESIALTDLFPYMQKRWNLKESKNLQKAILNHFTVKSHGLIRQGLAGLWWLVHLSVDESRDNKYELTEMLFKNYILRYVRFGIGKVIQHKEAAIGILQYLKDNEKNIPSMESVANGLTSYFNKLGAVKQLTFMDRDFFYDEMEIHIAEFKSATTRFDSDYYNDDE